MGGNGLWVRGPVALFGGLTCCLALAAFLAPAASASLDEIAAGCPSAAEVAALQADFSVSVEPDTSPAAACAVPITETQRRVFQTLQAIKSLNFARPLPWTNLSPYEWLRNAIDGIRVRADLPQNFCCDPPEVINLDASNFGDQWTAEWLLLVPLRTIVHEARHAEIGGHTCPGGNDLTFDEQGATAAGLWIGQWIGLFGGENFVASRPHQPSYYREQGIERALTTRICNAPEADLQVTTVAPAEVATAGQLTYATTLTNNGPDVAPRTYLSHDPSPGLEFVSASTDLGPCLTPAQTGGGPVVCEVGNLAAGASVAATFNYRVAAPAGTVLGGLDAGFPVGAPRVSADVHDPAPLNNAPAKSVSVVAGSGLVTHPTVDLAGRARTIQRGRKLLVRPGVTLSCPAGEEACTATATATAARGGRARPPVIGKARLQVAAGAQKAVAFRLNPRGLQLLGERAGLRATLTLSSRVGEGEPRTDTKAFTIKRRSRPRTLDW